MQLEVYAITYLLDTPNALRCLILICSLVFPQNESVTMTGLGLMNIKLNVFLVVINSHYKHSQ